MTDKTYCKTVVFGCGDTGQKIVKMLGRRLSNRWPSMPGFVCLVQAVPGQPMQASCGGHEYDSPTALNLAESLPLFVEDVFRLLKTTTTSARTRKAEKIPLRDSPARSWVVQSVYDYEPEFDLLGLLAASITEHSGGGSANAILLMHTQNQEGAVNRARRCIEKLKSLMDEPGAPKYQICYFIDQYNNNNDHLQSDVHLELVVDFLELMIATELGHWLEERQASWTPAGADFAYASFALRMYKYNPEFVISELGRSWAKILGKKLLIDRPGSPESFISDFEALRLIRSMDDTPEKPVDKAYAVPGKQIVVSEGKDAGWTIELGRFGYTPKDKIEYSSLELASRKNIDQHTQNESSASPELQIRLNMLQELEKHVETSVRAPDISAPLNRILNHGIDQIAVKYKGSLPQLKRVLDNTIEIVSLIFDKRRQTENTLRNKDVPFIEHQIRTWLKEPISDVYIKPPEPPFPWLLILGVIIAAFGIALTFILPIGTLALLALGVVGIVIGFKIHRSDKQQYQDEIRAHIKEKKAAEEAAKARPSSPVRLYMELAKQRIRLQVAKLRIQSYNEFKDRLEELQFRIDRLHDYIKEGDAFIQALDHLYLSALSTENAIDLDKFSYKQHVLSLKEIQMLLSTKEEDSASLANELTRFFESYSFTSYINTPANHKSLNNELANNLYAYCRQIFYQDWLERDAEDILYTQMEKYGNKHNILIQELRQSAPWWRVKRHALPSREFLAFGVKDGEESTVKEALRQMHEKGEFVITGERDLVLLRVQRGLNLSDFLPDHLNPSID